jgi:hypothetical protein
VEEIASDVINYVQQLQGLTPATHAAATHDAVQQWMDHAAGAEAVAAGMPTTTAAAGPPATPLRLVLVGQKNGSACEEAETAIRQGREKPC